MQLIQRRRAGSALFIACSFALLSACQGPDSALRTGGLGAVVGALAGQAIGHDTKSTLIGAGVGAAAGYIAGNEVDKSNLAKQQERTTTRPSK